MAHDRAKPARGEAARVWGMPDRRHTGSWVWTASSVTPGTISRPQALPEFNKKAVDGGRRDREAEAALGCCFANPGRDNANDFAPKIEQRSTRVPAIQKNIGLNEVRIGNTGPGAVKRTDHSKACAMTEAEGITDRNNEIARRGLDRVADATGR